FELRPPDDFEIERSQLSTLVGGDGEPGGHDARAATAHGLYDDVDHEEPRLRQTNGSLLRTSLGRCRLVNETDCRPLWQWDAAVFPAKALHIAIGEAVTLDQSQDLLAGDV